MFVMALNYIEKLIRRINSIKDINM